MSTHFDDGTPASNSREAEATIFAEALSKVLKNNNSSKPKLWEPDPFDGSDPHKLRTFILQCKLNFRDRKDAFEDDSDKVNYVLSYLKGTALDCFESAVLDPIEPLWLLDFDLFIEERNSKPTSGLTIQSAKQKPNSKDFRCTTVIKP